MPTWEWCSRGPSVTAINCRKIAYNADSNVASPGKGILSCAKLLRARRRLKPFHRVVCTDWSCHDNVIQAWNHNLPEVVSRLHCVGRLTPGQRVPSAGNADFPRSRAVSVCAKSFSVSIRQNVPCTGSVHCHSQPKSHPWDMEEGSVVAKPLPQTETDKEESGRLASAVGLIMGTAVGPGILGLPAATLQAGLIPSSVVIVGVWAYVMASVLLVAEISYAVMAEQGGAEVSFTGLAVCTLGQMTGRIVAAVYALLNYALLVACIAGLHSILSCWLPVPPALVCLLSPGIVVAMLAFTPFKAVDSLNMALCGLMLLSIASLVGIGIYVGRSMVLGSVGHGTWSWNALLPAVPVMVLTLGFHVITPLVCKVVGGSPNEARQVILCGGAVPLIMVLAWNAVILGLSPARPASSPLEPIKLLLSMSTVAAPAVQAFAFAALGTTLIGYALSFPKQLIDTVELFGFSKKAGSADELENLEGESRRKRVGVLIMAIGPPVCVAMICPTAFARALDFAGVYANCFLFGLLPPIMAWAHRYRQPQTGDATQLVPGGRLPLVLLFLSALFLGARPTALKV